MKNPIVNNYNFVKKFDDEDIFIYTAIFCSVIYGKKGKRSILNVIPIIIIIIFAVNILVIASTLTGFGNFGVA